MSFPPLRREKLPEPPKFWRMLGPSFILLGLGLGSGELIMWPYLAANFGLGIIWGAVLGISFQFFMNMEIERYTLVCGESVFVGLARKVRWVPVWFILSTVVPWMWPGIAAAAAAVLVEMTGWGEVRWVAIGLLLLMGLILSLGKVVYRTEVVLQTLLIGLGVPFIFGLAVFLAKASDWGALFSGMVGRGEGYWFLPIGIPMASFLGAFAYAGAGGNLNLAQSFYVKEKGYGMGKYVGRITSLLSGGKGKVELTGASFEVTGESVGVFQKWWRLINLEHGLVFWLTGAMAISLLALLAFVTVFERSGNLEGLNFLFAEARVIGERSLPVVGVVFLGVAAAMLFATQLSVFSATSRILGENLAIMVPEGWRERLPTYYYGFLWGQILLGVVVLAAGFSQPLTLLILGAVLNAAAMLVHTGLVLWLNLTSLARPLRPSLIRIGVMVMAFLFFGGFLGFTIVGGR